MNMAPHPGRILLLFAICVATLNAQQTSVTRLDGTTIAPAQIDAAVARSMNAARVTGAGIAIFNRGRIVYLKAYGFRDTANRLPLTPDSVMTAASLSKSAFATMVMTLVHDGRIDLDKPVYEYLPKPLPDYPRYSDLANDARYKNQEWQVDDEKLEDEATVLVKELNADLAKPPLEPR